MVERRKKAPMGDGSMGCRFCRMDEKYVRLSDAHPWKCCRVAEVGVSVAGAAEDVAAPLEVICCARGDFARLMESFWANYVGAHPWSDDMLLWRVTGSLVRRSWFQVKDGLFTRWFGKGRRGCCRRRGTALHLCIYPLSRTSSCRRGIISLVC